MSALTRAYKRISAEIAYRMGNTEKADGLVADVAAERATLAIEGTLRSGGHKPFSYDIDFAALDLGTKKYDSVRGAFETMLKPVVDKATTRGLRVELTGQDSWNSLAHSGPASIRIKIAPAQNLG